MGLQRRGGAAQSPSGRTPLSRQMIRAPVYTEVLFAQTLGKTRNKEIASLRNPIEPTTGCGSSTDFALTVSKSLALA